MVQSDKKGVWQPTKIFPCDCGTEGLVVVVEEDKDFFDCEGAPFVGISFWQFGSKFENNTLSRWERIKYALHILRGKSPWTDQVWMRSTTAKNLANHILYLVNKVRKSNDSSKPLVDWPKEKIE